MEGLTIEHKWWLKIEHVQWNSEVFAAPGQLTDTGAKQRLRIALCRKILSA
jgi:hypothetical protein